MYKKAEPSQKMEPSGNDIIICLKSEWKPWRQYESFDANLCFLLMK